jgi:Family of unknown function (DUF6489)
MKINIDIDCTPQEARSFLGLPDLGPLHAVYLERMEALVRDGLKAEDVESMMRAWMPLMSGGMEQWQKLFWNAANKP